MLVLVISDSHGMLKMPKIKPDLVILLGDIDFYEIRKIDQLFTCPKIGVLGNHDAPDFFEDTSIYNMHKQYIQINGITFAGFEGCPRYNKRTYLQYDEIDVHEFTQSLPKVDVFISHANPQFVLSNDVTDAHRGFRSYTSYIEEKQPRFFLHGHIHDQDAVEAGNTKIVSVYPIYTFNL